MIIDPMYPSSPLPSGTLPLAHLGVIRAEGDDAAKFIHGQLTQDFSLLGLDQARLAAFCSVKGRMLASFIGFKRSATEILLLCNQDLLPATLKRLSMFVMRSKVKLNDASTEFLVHGLSGSATMHGALSQNPAAELPWQAQRSAVATVISLYPAGDVARQLWVAPAGTPVLASTGAVDPETWAWGDVISGVAMISQPVVDAFVPQMLNYESIGGVSFKKGCYPGQEVVARSQFRGTLKRRGYIVSAAVKLQAGDEIYAPDDASQPVGTVVQAAADPLGSYAAIASLQVAAADAGQLRLRGNEGPALNLLPLPYRLLEDL